MQVFVSLWSADPLDLRSAIASVDDDASGYHMDVFDGHNVPELLFGPDVVAALRTVTRLPIEVHLNVTNPHYWVDRFADVGADILTVQSKPCPDLNEVLLHISARSCRPSLGLELHEPIEWALAHLRSTDRILLLGTRIGVKGQHQDAGTAGRVAALAQARSTGDLDFEIVVDGGIRKQTVPALAAAGADAVVAGSLVLGAGDRQRALHQIAALPVGEHVAELDSFWGDPPEPILTANEKAPR